MHTANQARTTAGARLLPVWSVGGGARQGVLPPFQPGPRTKLARAVWLTTAGATCNGKLSRGEL